MHLFSRNVQFNGPTSEVMAHAASLRAYVAEKSGLDVGLWSVVFGAPVGTCTYSARVDGLAGVQAMAMSLAGDAKWEALLAKGADWYTGAPSDALASPLHGSLDGGSPPLGSVAQVTSAVVAGGAYVAAITWVSLSPSTSRRSPATRCCSSARCRGRSVGCAGSACRPMPPGRMPPVRRWWETRRTSTCSARSETSSFRAVATNRR